MPRRPPTRQRLRQGLLDTDAPDIREPIRIRSPKGG
jgi:hypothetical protein